MKSGLLVGLSALVWQILAQVNIPAVQDFDAQKFAGPWYLISMVMDEVVVEDAVIVNMTATPTQSGDIRLDIVVSKDDNMCILEKVSLMHTQQPGVFKITGGPGFETCSTANQHGYPFETINCDVTVHIVKADYGSYYILHFATVNNRILHLYTRRKKQVSDQKKQFKKAAISLKFDLNKMMFETRNVKCDRVWEKNWKLKRHK